MDVTNAVRARIWEFCQEKDITINKLANICGIPPTTLVNAMNKRNGLTVITLKKICDGLEITLGEFFQTETFDSLEQEIK